MPEPLINEAVKAKVADLLSGMSLKQKITYFIRSRILHLALDMKTIMKNPQAENF